MLVGGSRVGSVDPTMSASGWRPLVIGTRAISGDKGYGHGAGFFTSPSSVVLWDKEVSLRAREGLDGVCSDSQGRMGNPPQSLSMLVLGASVRDVEGISRRESLDSGAFDGATFHPRNQGAALAMLNAGMRVDPVIQESFVSAQARASSVEVVSNNGSDSFLADNLLSNVDDLQSV
ncbi:hypothetical protein NE237_017603 [Protea cynaroides]|uniref:Uncharacterized protein n=1 Tax=Protea cynaroides TaxID=273540 RepID=A0A9Q0K8B7_9MAGN|nr:hypothetical protein NE237_017603 [Protea cynaroides]